MDSPISEEQPPPHQSPRREEPPKECLHKTKTIQFFSRPIPIILQNDNGPCPLLAICNVLLLRNQLNLSADISEVSQEKLLSLVAERLIDSNSNTDNKDSEYVQNQRQNIADAIDLLPRLTTGIDVNIKFQRIGDFEFTRECAIFDLLDIPLYHGWLVDPQDYATAKAIGSKSYNTITRELVSLQEMLGKAKVKSQEDCVDFAAATAATLGVPSPCLSIAKSFNDSPCVASEPDVRKGDVEEEEELLRVMKLSENESSIDERDSIAAGSNGENVIVSSNENLHQMQTAPTSSIDKLHEDDHNGKVHGEPSVSGGTDLSCSRDDLISFEEPDHSSANETKPSDQFSVTQSEGSLLDDLTNVATGPWGQNETKPPPYCEIDSVSIHDQDTHLESSTYGLMETPMSDGHEHPASTILGADHLQIHSALDAGLGEKIIEESGIEKATVISGPSDSPIGNIQKTEATESFTSSLNDSEPIYEGEECILDSVATVCEDREPIYEGEVVLAKHGDGNNIDVHDSCSNEITPEEGELISSFLKYNASQLTFYGLFSLQDGLKERELCVFFRNNHFCTMFKVNGDSVFCDSDFKEFRQDGSSINSDLQLVIALQQQEYEQQQPQRRAVPQQPPAPTLSSSRLITGPQVLQPQKTSSLFSDPYSPNTSPPNSNLL